MQSSRSGPDGAAVLVAIDSAFAGEGADNVEPVMLARVPD
jgi:hypothetical protein